MPGPRGRPRDTVRPELSECSRMPDNRRPTSRATTPCAPSWTTVTRCRVTRHTGVQAMQTSASNPSRSVTRRSGAGVVAVARSHQWLTSAATADALRRFRTGKELLPERTAEKAALMELPDLSGWGIDTSDAYSRPPARGTNNDVRIIETPSGNFVWRRYDNLTIDQVRTEHALLRWLAGRNLAFRVPAPVTTSSSSTFVVLADGRAATLQPLIPGRRPATDDREIAITATAFATLLHTLADAPREFAPRDWTMTQLADMHGGVADADELLDRLASYGADLGWLRDALDTETDVSCALQELPQQIVHGDVALSNALTDAGRITGLLDFEIAGWDARISDVGTALLSLGGDPATESGRERIALVSDCFRERTDLTGSELDILPEVVR